MSFLVCLILVLAAVRLGGPAIKKHAGGLYLVSAVLAVLVTAVTALDLVSEIPMALDLLLWRPLAHGTLATAVWAAVMYAGAVSNGSALQRQVMPIRGELSIIASILTLGHNLAAGQEYFVRLLPGGGLRLSEMLATVCSLVMLAVMLPLFVTSFPSVRKKMDAKRWKRLQRWAYLFYGLTYLHVLLLFVPIARMGKGTAVLNLLIFTMVFLGYGFLRVTKARAARGSAKKTVPALVTGAAALLVLLFCLPVHSENVPRPEAEASAPPSETAAPEQVKPLPSPVPGAERKYQDGTFSGKGKGYAGPVKVDVTIKGDVITDIVITEQVEDEPYWTRALVTVDRILEEQTVDVDNVAGATKSVKGIKKAVKNALKQAKI